MKFIYRGNCKSRNIIIKSPYKSPFGGFRGWKLGFCNYLYIPLFSILFVFTIYAKKTVYDTLIYTHDTHEKEYKVGNCEVCHENIKTSKRARDDNYADDQSCHTSGCHDIKDQDSCFVCHTNAEAETPPKPKHEIKNNHKIHSKNNIECKVCHTTFNEHTYFTRKEIPKMTICIDCHKKERINNDCEYCHTDITITMSHERESKDWHGQLFNQFPSSCDLCHTNSYCSKCHQGLVSQDVHPSNYLHTHKFDVFSSRSNCLTCHSSSYSCDECHKKSWGKTIDHKNILNTNTSCKSCHRSK